METRAPQSPSMASSQALLLSNERLSGGCHRLAVRLPETFPTARPGQFCMVSLDDPRFPLLPRPFSLLGCATDDEGLVLEFMVMPVGRGSGMLCSVSPGDVLQLVGPLGQSLSDALESVVAATQSPSPGAPSAGDTVICVAGGYGVAPFLFLAETWKHAGDPRHPAMTVIFGARSAERLTLADRLACSGVRVELCTEDGSRGYHGRVDGRLAEILAGAASGGHSALVLSCGPEAMMEAVGRVSRAAAVPAIASLETVMGCGYAVCNGCAVAVDSVDEADGFSYELACREGTMFDSQRLHWKRL